MIKSIPVSTLPSGQNRRNGSL